MADQLLIDIPRRNFHPGETVEGGILWDCGNGPDELILRLGWWTEGRGDRDERIVAERTWDRPGPVGKEKFSFEIPEECVPSFSGRLVSVVWGLQLSGKGIRTEDVVENLTVSPTGSEIDISGNTYESKGKSFSFGKGRGLPLSNRR